MNRSHIYETKPEKAGDHTYPEHKFTHMTPLKKTLPHEIPFKVMGMAASAKCGFLSYYVATLPVNTKLEKKKKKKIIWRRSFQVSTLVSFHPFFIGPKTRENLVMPTF